MKELGFHDTIVIMPWEKVWEKKFRQEKDSIKLILHSNGLDAQILHVGSTSIQDMPSKPIIDILMLIEDEKPFEPFIDVLQQAEYRCLGECDRPGRYFFTKGDLPNNSFYLHLCRKDHQVAKDQLLFQKIERSDSTVFRNYISMKYLAASAYPDDRTFYRILKGTFINTVLHLYREMKP